MKSEAWREELDQLLCEAELRGLDETDNLRLSVILREHDDALELMAQSLETEALLHWHHGAARPRLNAARRPQRGRLMRMASLAAALAAITVTAYLNWDPVPSDTLSHGGIEGPSDGLVLPPVAGHVLPTRPVSTRVVQAGRWELEVPLGAEFEMTAPGEVQLTRGELLVRSTAEAPGELSIDTPNGLVRAQDAEFYVGTHEAAKEPLVMNRLTRVLVLSGTVALANSLGNTEASGGEYLVAGSDRAPIKGVANANNSFGIDLYQELAKSDGNLFFSPYSISLALAMALEGARDETATELARVLHVPGLMRRVGDDLQRLPFAMSDLHGGHQAITKLLEDARNSPEQVALRKRHAELAPIVASLKARIEKLSDSGQIKESNVLRRELWGPRDELAQLERDIASYEISIANALFGEATYPFATEYLRTMHFAYGTDGLVNVDFVNHPDRELEFINDWVGGKTKGLISDLLAPGTINSRTRLALVSAVYFRGNWVEPFKANKTEKKTFSISGDTSVQVPMMVNWGMERSRYGAFNADGSHFATPESFHQGQTEGLYPSEEGFEILEIPYQGNDLSMMVLLPRTHAGMEPLEARLSGANISRWIDQLEQREVHVELPKFDASSSFSLQEALGKLGVRRAFRNPALSSGAQFGGMTDSELLEEQLYVTSVVHQATISVDEMGSEAAAATVVSMTLAGSVIQALRPFTPDFLANRPFVYAIRDRNSGTILFLGRMVNPE